MTKHLIGLFEPIVKRVTESSETPVIPEKNLYPVVNAKDLLANIYYESILNNVAKITNASDGLYDLYVQTAKNLAEFVQIIPTTAKSRIGSMLQESLQRSLFAVEIYHQEKQVTESIWSYVLFTIGLLLDVGRINLERTIVISSENGEFQQRWIPYEGSLVDQQAHYYKIREGGGIIPWASKYTTVQLAHLLMPPEGFKWIASRPQTLSTWVALLSDDTSAVGTFGLILNRAKELLDNFLEQNITPSIPIEPLDPEDVALGEEFAKWLKNNIKNENISINESDSKIHVTVDGLFVDSQLFREFSRSVHGFKTGFIEWRVVLKQFNHLGYTRLSGYDYKFDQFFAEHPDVASKKAPSFLSGNYSKTAPQREGVLISSSDWILGNKNLPISQYIHSSINNNDYKPTQIQPDPYK